MNLLIVEDEKVLLDKYSDYLKEVFSSIRTARSKEDAFQLIEEHEFDVALIDYNLPDGKGLDILRGYPKNGDAPVFIMLTAYSKERLAIECLNIGVYKYLEKPIEKKELIHTLTEAREEASNRDTIRSLKRKFTISERVANVLIEKYQVSNRELEVLKSIIIHGKNKIVAEKLFISQGTVRNHLSNIFQKVHVNTKEQLNGLIEELNSKS